MLNSVSTCLVKKTSGACGSGKREGNPTMLLLVDTITASSRTATVHEDGAGAGTSVAAGTVLSWAMRERASSRERRGVNGTTIRTTKWGLPERSVDHVGDRIGDCVVRWQSAGAHWLRAGYACAITELSVGVVAPTPHCTVGAENFHVSSAAARAQAGGANPAGERDGASGRVAPTPDGPVLAQ